MSDTSLPGLLLRMVISLGVVLGLMLVAGRLLSGRWAIRGLPRTRPPAGGRGAAPRANRPPRLSRGNRSTGPDALQLIARQSIGRTHSIQVIQACGRTLVLGVSAESVTLLAAGDEAITDPRHTELDDEDRPPTNALAPLGLKPVLDAWRDRTVRRT